MRRSSAWTYLRGLLDIGLTTQCCYVLGGQIQLARILTFANAFEQIRIHWTLLVILLYAANGACASHLKEYNLMREYMLLAVEVAITEIQLCLPLVERFLDLCCRQLLTELNLQGRWE